MSDWAAWLVLAGVLGVVELMTGTFYLLMLSTGALAGAVAASMGLSNNVQMGVGAVVACTALLGLRAHQKSTGQLNPTDAGQDMLDLGQKVVVKDWDAQGKTRVDYRGAQWQARSVDTPATVGEHRIVRIEGSELLLTRTA